jgi:hypothetical protein
MNLCQDYYPEVYDEINGSNQGKSEKVRCLIDGVKTQGTEREQELFRRVRSINPNGYDKYLGELTPEEKTTTVSFPPTADYQNTLPPKVFISYAHPSRSDRKRELLKEVLRISNRLRGQGIDCYIDQYMETIPQNWEEWIQERVEWADFVLILCTDRYYHRFSVAEIYEEGAIYQGGVVTEEMIYDEDSKFIPITFNTSDERVPNILEDGRRIYREVSANGSTEYEFLYRYLIAQQLPESPELKILPPLPPLHRKQKFYSKKIYSNIPERGKCSFVGRELEIQQLLEKISSSQHIHNIHGMGGIGKTSLAIEIAHQCLEARKGTTPTPNIPYFDAFLFFSFRKNSYPDYNTFVIPEIAPEYRVESLSDIHRIIAGKLKNEGLIILPTEDRFSESYNALSRQPTLLLVDNTENLSFEEAEKVRKFLNGVPSTTKVIISTRHPFTNTGISLTSLEENKIKLVIKQESSLRNINLTEDLENAIYHCAGGNFSIIKFILNESTKATSNLAKVLDPENGSILGAIKEYVGDEIDSLDDLQRQIFIAAVNLPNLSHKDLLLEVAGIASTSEGRIDQELALERLNTLGLLVGKVNDRYLIEPTTYKYAKLTLKCHPDVLNAMEDRKIKYYINFAKKYGGEDWGDWRDNYAYLEQEWSNIQSIINKYIDREDWNNLFEIWQWVDRYFDLSMDWGNRLRYWNLIENSTNPRIKAQALAEKSWTKILIGRAPEDYLEAKQCLLQAWKYSFDDDDLIKANIANYLAIIHEYDDKNEAKEWLAKEFEILENGDSTIDERTRTRCRVRNLCCRARLEDDLGLSEFHLRSAIELCKIPEIDWLRFLSYAQNELADVLVKQSENNLDEAERLLNEAESLLDQGIKFPIKMHEERRIALYYLSFSKLYWQKIKLYEPASSQDVRNYEYKENFITNIDKAQELFYRLKMKPETKKITRILDEVKSLGIQGLERLF